MPSPAFAPLPDFSPRPCGDPGGPAASSFAVAAAGPARAAQQRDICLTLRLATAARDAHRAAARAAAKGDPATAALYTDLARTRARAAARLREAGRGWGIGAAG